MPVRQVIIPPCVKDELREKILKEGNRKFFWLDYVGAYIEEESSSIRRLHDTMYKFMIVTIAGLATTIITVGTALTPVCSALSITASIGLMVVHLSYILKISKTEKIMGLFMEESRDMTFKIGGLK